jgi:two-component system response regulator DesR
MTRNDQMNAPRQAVDDRIIRILVADDSSLLRDASGEWLGLRDGLEIVALASSGLEAVEMAEAASPDLAILDVRMPGLDGLEAARQITARRPHTDVIIHTGEAGAPILDAAREAGARGFVRKGDTLDQLLEAIYAVAAGELAFPTPT